VYQHNGNDKILNGRKRWMLAFKKKGEFRRTIARKTDLLEWKMD